jgi:hypothetical protein
MATDSTPPAEPQPPQGEQPTAMFNKKMHEYFNSLLDPSELEASPAATSDVAESLAESLAESFGPSSNRLSIPPDRISALPPPRAPAGSLPALADLEIGPEIRPSANQPELRPAESTRTMTVSGPPPPMRVQAPAPLVNTEQEAAPSRLPLIIGLMLLGLAVAAGVMFLGLRGH